MNTVDLVASSDSQSRKLVGWSLLTGLLLLRIPLLGFGTLFAEEDWIDPVFEIGTYFLTACLIWWERERLADFHIDTLAVSLIILFKPIQTLILAAFGMAAHPLAFPRLGGILLWIIAVALFLALRFSRPRMARISRASIGWFGWGLLAGLLTVVLLGYPASFQVEDVPARLPQVFPLVFTTLRGLFYQLGYAAVTEEPLFRGFLWGYLRKAGWKNVWIWLFQTGLFMLAHIYYINQLPISFWILVPVSTLVLGALAWRSKTIASSLGAHTMMNASGFTIGTIVATLRM
ncbi:MAG: CPBP family intramembrane metalloprotease [Anaerolineae bacterium]|nr:CPBP family intramembrane metalloprotease [Anaerolineae bacterium]